MRRLISSQGGQIMDDAFCGGGDTNEGLTSTAIPIQASAVNMIKAAIFMGDPRHIPGLSYDVGTCQANGVSTSFLLRVFNSSSSPLNDPGFCFGVILTVLIVCSPPSWVPMPICQQDSVLLRRRGSILLQWK